MDFFGFADKLSIVKILLDKSPEVINAKNDRGETPLFLAALSKF